MISLLKVKQAIGRHLHGVIMPAFPAVKTSLVNQLWLPLVISGGDLLYHRRTAHKKMKMFTLTDSNCLEVKVFEKNKLISGSVIAWQQSSLEAIRLETELSRGAKVVSDGRFDELIVSDSDAVSGYFPSDIINLDFLSQGTNLTQIKELRTKSMVLISL